MAWFCNYYTCDRCGKSWTDEWSCTCDDDCQHCEARHMSPDHSDDLTELIIPEGNKFVVLWSPETAGHDPDYRELGTFPTREKAEAFLRSG